MRECTHKLITHKTLANSSFPFALSTRTSSSYIYHVTHICLTPSWVYVNAYACLDVFPAPCFLFHMCRFFATLLCRESIDSSFYLFLSLSSAPSSLPFSIDPPASPPSIIISEWTAWVAHEVEAHFWGVVLCLENPRHRASPLALAFTLRAGVLYIYIC